MFAFGGGCGKHGGGFGPPWARMHKGRGEHCGPGALLNALDLSDEQLEKLAELKMEGCGQFAKFKSEMIGLVQEIGKELTKDQVDKNKVKEIAQRIKARKSDLGDSMLDRILSFTEVLSVEQRKRLRILLIKKFLGVDSPAPEAE
ncbi:MAG TPA: periplasmic heavy metal sensor [Planktothrix sp.]|jgi:Spy/CpxP family protein refolding chaperone